ncbi:MAG: cysteine-rich CWC family protein [Bacteroidetes bacterium]|nr:cysteine-rich CWC family protein [Bacteroidota bacterium]
MSDRLNTYSKHEPKHCPRCNKEFVCNPFNISSCDCNNIQLSPEETTFIANQFSDCVCNACLKELKHAYDLIQHHDKT